MLNLLATNISTMDDLDAGHCISSLRYILHRATKTAGPPSKDSAVSHYSQFMEKAMVTPFIPGSQEYVNKRALLAFLIWRACHEELAQKDWPRPGDAPQNCPALFEAYDALNMNYSEYRADFEQAWNESMAKAVGA